jgi:hypothetical protein
MEEGNTVVQCQNYNCIHNTANVNGGNDFDGLTPYCTKELIIIDDIPMCVSEEES